MNDIARCYKKWALYREYLYSVAVYEKYQTRLGEFINFRALERK